MPEIVAKKPKTETVSVPRKLTETISVPGKKKGEERVVKFPYYQAVFCCIVPPDHVLPEGVQYKSPITVEMAKQLLGWETEDDFKVRRLKEDPTLKESKLHYGTEYTLKDGAGEKVKCWNNSSNRPFNAEHVKKLRQDVLTGDWMMNCESIIVSRTGIVLSGQHRLICVILAHEEWEKQVKWQEQSKGVPPFIESLVAFGASDDPRVLQTLDNVMPRSFADTVYTSPLFAGKSQAARVKLSDMIAKGIKLLWTRLNATKGGFIEKMTNSALNDFHDRHKRVNDAVKHLHDEMGDEGGNVFQTMKLSSGACAAMLYLMGQSGTDEKGQEKYSALTSAHTEKQLDWKRWDKALEFWSEMAKNPDADKPEDKPAEWVGIVRNALSALDGPTGRGGTPRQRHAVLALAWNKFFLKEKFTDKMVKEEQDDGTVIVTHHDLWPKLVYDENRNRRIIEAGNEPVCGGADLGEQWDEDDKDGEDDQTTPETVKDRAAAIRAENDAAVIAKAKGTLVTADVTKKVVPVPTPPNKGVLSAKVPATPTGRGPNNEEPKKTMTPKTIPVIDSRPGAAKKLPTPPKLPIRKPDGEKPSANGNGEYGGAPAF